MADFLQEYQEYRRAQTRLQDARAELAAERRAMDAANREKAKALVEREKLLAEQQECRDKIAELALRIDGLPIGLDHEIKRRVVDLSREIADLERIPEPDKGELLALKEALAGVS